MNILGNAIKELRKQKRLTQAQLSELTGFNQNTISNHENGNRTLDETAILKYAKALDVKPKYFFDYFDNDQDTFLDKITAIIPRLDKNRQKKVLEFTESQWSSQKGNIDEGNIRYLVNGRKSAAGSMIEVDDSLAKQDVLPYSMVPNGADELVEITGNSMEPLIKKGTEVFLRYQPSVENGEIAIVRIENEGVTCKRFYMDQEAKTITLKSENSTYKDMHFDPSQITVLGKVLFR